MCLNKNQGGKRCDGTGHTHYEADRTQLVRNMRQAIADKKFEGPNPFIGKSYEECVAMKATYAHLGVYTSGARQSPAISTAVYNKSIISKARKTSKAKRKVEVNNLLTEIEQRQEMIDAKKQVLKDMTVNRNKLTEKRAGKTTTPEQVVEIDRAIADLDKNRAEVKAWISDAIKEKNAKHADLARIEDPEGAYRARLEADNEKHNEKHNVANVEGTVVAPVVVKTPNTKRFEDYTPTATEKKAQAKVLKSTTQIRAQVSDLMNGEKQEFEEYYNREEKEVHMVAGDEDKNHVRVTANNEDNVQTYITVESKITHLPAEMPVSEKLTAIRNTVKSIQEKIENIEGKKNRALANGNTNTGWYEPAHKKLTAELAEAQSAEKAEAPAATPKAKRVTPAQRKLIKDIDDALKISAATMRDIGVEPTPEKLQKEKARLYAKNGLTL